MGCHGRRALLLAGVAVALALNVAGAAERYELQAAFLYRFATYVEWPPAVQGVDLSLCVIGERGFGAQLEQTIGEREIRGRRVSIRHAIALSDLASCHVVYVGTTEKERAPEILDSLAERSVLTVSGLGGFIESGGVIQFVRTGSKLRFEVNQAAARAAGLRISAQLLKLALAVHTGAPAP
jgi:hypothetical protein